MLPEDALSDEEAFAVELWACGFNAFGQLHFDNEKRNLNFKDRHEEVEDPAYEDIRTFKKILVDEKKIEFRRGGYNTVLSKYLKNHKKS
jgi:hypothetical protein